MRRRLLLLILLVLSATAGACGRGVEEEPRSPEGSRNRFVPAPPPTGGFGPVQLTPRREQAAASTSSAGSNAAGCWATPGLTEYTLAPAGGKPSALAAAPDGSVWFSDPGTTSIGRLEASGVVTRYPLPAGRMPGALAVGPDGSVWFSATGPAIGRLTPSGDVVGYAVPPARGGPYSEPGAAAPGAFVAGPDGAMWFVEAEADLVGRVARDGAIMQYPLPSAARMHVHPEGITVGSDGAVWFTEPLSGGLGRIDVHTFGISEFPMPSDHTGAPPSSVVPGHDGGLWFDTGSGLGRMTTKGSGTLFPFPQPGRYAPTSVAAGPDGRIWLLDGPDGKVLRMSFDGAVSALPALADPKGISFAGLQQMKAGPDAVWVAEPSLDRIGRYACQSGAH